MKIKRRPTYTVDASVVLKWYSEDEEDLENALQLREEYKVLGVELTSPELLIYEVANVLRYKMNLEEQFVLGAVVSLYEMRILMSVNQTIMENAVRLARRFGVTVYDSTYISFSQYYQYPLITADKRMFQKIRSHPGVILLTDFFKIGNRGDE